VKITDFLTSDSVIPNLAGKDKQSVLDELAKKFASAHGVADSSRVLQVLHEREKISTTAIGEGVAIPHGKLADIDRLRAVFARSTAGVDFASLDGAPTHLFFALVGPENGAADHLKAMARISRLLKEQEFRDRLLRARSDRELFEIIAAEDEKF
jgi:PTS system nitrogen regulatory IIA component